MNIAKKRMVTYTWIHSKAWIDKNWKKLKSLCTEEEYDMEPTEVLFVRAKPLKACKDKVLFVIQSNSWYVCWYMMQFKNDTMIKTIKK